MLRWAVLLLLCPAAKAQEVEGEHRLRGVRMSLDVHDAPLESVLDVFRNTTGVNIVLDPVVIQKGPVSVTITVKNLAARSLLTLILHPRGLLALWKDGVLWVTTRAKGAETTKLRITDVRDLLYPLQDFPGVDFTPASDSPGTTFDAGEAIVSEEFPLVEILRAHTGGKSWEEDSKVSISLSNGLLIVRQTAEVHAQIYRLLAKLRRSK